MSTPESEVVQNSTNEEVTLETLENLADAIDRGETQEPERQPGNDPGESTPEGETQTETESSVDAEGDGSLTSESEDSKPTKAEKDNARLDKTWKKVNEDKQSLAEEKAAFEKEREEFYRNKAQQTDEYRDANGQTAKDYERYAQQMEADGEYDKADWAKKQAEKVNTEAKLKAQEADTKAFQEKWSDNFEKAAEENPDLNTRTSDLYQKVEALMRSKPYLTQYPEGILDAVEVAKMQLSKSTEAELRDSLTKTQQELEEYKSKLSISGSPPADRPGEASFDNLSDEDQFKKLERLAAEYDRGGQALIGG